jgi:hypothetical protein
MEEGSRLVAESPSYTKAEDKLYRLAGAAISDTTLWRIFGEVGEQSLAILEGEEAASSAPIEEEEQAGMERVEAFDPLIGERASTSVDGTMVLTREEGWKEVKGVTVSVIEEGPGRNKRSRHHSEAARSAATEPEIHLTRHSYRLRLASADDFALVQYAEADRRRLQYARDLASVNDGAPWCWRITIDNLPEAIEILDWAHALGHVAAVGQAAFGEESAEAEAWYKEVKDVLWEGAVEQLLGEKWQKLPRRQRQRGKTIRNGRAYFREHKDRMRYKTFRDQGYPIGSGVVESACKNVVQWRMKRGGARWSKERVNPMLAVLGELHSGRWDELWGRVRLLRCA